MLHRSFKPAKCKTSLKLAASRIKLLKNKREAQVKHLKRELAQLLESGQDQTARIRVEHVVREEKTMAAYDLLEIYCELIVARLPIIESQKNCPIDLKDAISSVIFASPRCADIPELMDVRKHFTAKYGKEFVSAAVELRPDCGVSRLLVEKLSAKAPDGPTKIKILSAIAEEHNVQWDPMSFGEKDSKPSEDLLNGPNTFGNASQMYANPSYAETPTGREEDKVPSKFHVPPKSNEKHDVPVNLHEHNTRTSPGSQTNTDTHKAIFSAAFHPHPESMASASGTERMVSRHSHAGDESTVSMGRHDWNMEFKDATAAAHAAAESAERASMAARAAAELSSRGNTRHYSAESQRDEEPHRYADSRLQSEHHAKGPVNVALHGRNTGMDYEQINSTQQYDVMAVGKKFHWDSFKSINKSSQSASLKSSGASMDGDPSVNNLPVADRYFRKNSSELGQGDHFGQGSFEKQSSKSEVDYENKLQEGQGSFKKQSSRSEVDYVNKVQEGQDDRFGKVSFKKQSSRSEVDYVNKQQEGLSPKNVGGFEEASHTSSPSGSGTFSDDHAAVSNFNSQSLGGGDDYENPFAVNNMGNILRNSNKSSSPENATVVFDDYCSDQDECEINLEGKQTEHEYFDFSSHGRKLPTDMFANTNAWTERKTVDDLTGISASQTHFYTEHRYDPVFSESLPSSTVPSHPDDMLPVNFDDSDASISENDEERDKSKLIRSKDTNRSNVYSRTSEVIRDDCHGFADSSLADKGNEGFSKLWSRSSSNPVEVHSDRDQGIRVDAGSARKFGHRDVTTSQSSPRFMASEYDPDSYDQQEDKEKHQKSQQPSRFSMGHEHRGNVVIPPPVEATEDIETLKESSPESGKKLNFANLTGGFRNKGYKRPQYVTSPAPNASSSKQTAEDTSPKVEESLSATVKVSSSTGARSQDPYNRKVRTESDGRPSTGAHFGSYDNDSYYELPQRTSTSSQERDSEKAGIEESKRSRSRPQVKYFDSTDSDSEDDFPKEALMSKPHLNPVFSQRTKASPTNSEKNSYSKTTVFSEDSGSLGHNEEWSYPSKNAYSAQNRQKPLSGNKSSGRLGISEKPKLVEEPANKPIRESKKSSFVERSARQSNPPPNRATSGSSSTESLKTSRGETQIPSKEKASHVHPKLPDYDAISAHLHSLRKNRP